MAKVKKIYKYANRLVDVCKWCEGTGYNRKAFTDKPCFICNGLRGRWEQVKELIGEEVTE